MRLTPDPIATPRRRRQTPRLGAVGAGIALFFSALVVACTAPRAPTYPPAPVRIDSGQVAGRMASMSRYLRQIEDLLGDNAVVSSEQQTEIVALLNRIVDVTDELGAGGADTGHFLIDTYIDAFRLDLDLALRNASADPPNYFALGRVAGSCAACHQHR